MRFETMKRFDRLEGRLEQRLNSMKIEAGGWVEEAVKRMEAEEEASLGFICGVGSGKTTLANEICRDNQVRRNEAMGYTNNMFVSGEVDHELWFSTTVVREVYKVKLLSADESLSLFCHSAFGQTSVPPTANETLVKQGESCREGEGGIKPRSKAVSYAGLQAKKYRFRFFVPFLMAAMGASHEHAKVDAERSWNAATPGVGSGVASMLAKGYSFKNLDRMILVLGGAACGRIQVGLTLPISSHPAEHIIPTYSLLLQPAVLQNRIPDCSRVRTFQEHMVPRFKSTPHSPQARSVATPNRINLSLWIVPEVYTVALRFRTPKTGVDCIGTALLNRQKKCQKPGS
ncbi:hypothetical protein F3Y22_tig00110556pilonHSYRG00716 [Hibiscus syriacus]|uniref:Uncharacterized protein n=1 Tax=Hibiscus syriacus TaxID=106335 RepID=A0A6A3AD35_HIBSY|nr:hypothetical protein F3Y22_tig00110556pilonHSYRG00716 [Hibiscus syriacus]